jgi:dihydropyrimidinase
VTALLIRGGTLVDASRSTSGDLLVRDGRIAAAGAIATDEAGDATVLDAHGLLVMPGGIDTHTHLAHPIDRMGISTADDFYTGTVAGACGGVTTIIDFALQRKGDSLPDVMERRVAEAGADAVIDFGLHMIVTDVRDDVIDQIPTLIEDGHPSFKIYMTYADKVVPDDDLMRVLEATAEHGGLVYLHCENDCAVRHLIHRFREAGHTGPMYHARSRPPQVEAEATNRAIMLAEVVGAPVCIAHVTSAQAAAHVADARGRSAAVAAETCPQYLVLTEERYRNGGDFEAGKYVCSPPLRPGGHPEALWGHLADGSIQQVSSDHAPFRFADQKTQGRDDFTRIPNGLPGIETRLPILFSEGVSEGRISANRFVEITATNPAKIFGLYPRKGSLEVGADADVVLFDPRREVTIDHADLHSAVDYSPFQGMRIKGMPVVTISRGEVVARDGEAVGERGRGRRVERSAIRPVNLP